MNIAECNVNRCDWLGNGDSEVCDALSLWRGTRLWSWSTHRFLPKLYIMTSRSSLQVRSTSIRIKIPVGDDCRNHKRCCSNKHWPFSGV